MDDQDKIIPTEPGSRDREMIAGCPNRREMERVKEKVQ